MSGTIRDYGLSEKRYDLGRKKYINMYKKS